MKFDKNLSDFNRRFVEEWIGIFPKDVEAFQSDDGALHFRGPMPNDQTQIGTHVTVWLEHDVVLKLNNASPSKRRAMTDVLIWSLGAYIKMQYDPNGLRPPSLKAVGKMNVLDGDCY